MWVGKYEFLYRSLEGDFFFLVEHHVRVMRQGDNGGEQEWRQERVPEISHHTNDIFHQLCRQALARTMFNHCLFVIF